MGSLVHSVASAGVLVLVFLGVGCNSELGAGSDGADGGITEVEEPDGAVVNPGADDDMDSVPNSEDNCPRTSNPDQLDTDLDGIGSACDCDPDDDQVVAYMMIEDDLRSDRGVFTTPDGFAPESWTYSADGYLQGRLVDDSTDVTLMNLDQPVKDLFIEATVVSTEIASFGDDDLRQIMLIGRADASADNYEAVGCGIEVVEGLSPTQKTSVVTYSGNPNGIAMTPIDRTNRNLVVENEELRMRMVLQGTQMTCTVTLDGTEVTVAQGTVPDGTGSVGFHTRETKARFTGVRACELP